MGSVATPDSIVRRPYPGSGWWGRISGAAQTDQRFRLMRTHFRFVSILSVQRKLRECRHWLGYVGAAGKQPRPE